MKMTKTIEIFDSSVFKIGKTYYIQNLNSRALYLCTQINGDNVYFKNVVGLQGKKEIDFTINNDNYKCMLEVEPIDFTVEFDSTISEWFVSTAICEGDKNESLQG